MANYSSLGQNANVKKDENVVIFPYRILNDLSKKLNVAEAAIMKMSAEREALESVKNEEINKLKQQILELTHQNNRYHLAISYCTVCATDAADSEVSSSTSDVSINASTPVTTSLATLEPSISPIPCSDVPSSVALALSSQPLLSSSFKTRQADSIMQSKEKNFILKMVKKLDKLETKYLTPEHKRKKRLFSRKEKTSPIVPKEFDSIYHALTAPESKAVDVPEPFPRVRWNDVKFKPVLPNPEPCPVLSCSQDPKFYQDTVDKSNYGYPIHSDSDFVRLSGKSFGTLPGYKTSLGIVAVPTNPVGGYVYCPDARKWVLFAEPFSSRGTRRGGTPIPRRRKG